jgi:hypothetical protein
MKQSGCGGKGHCADGVGVKQGVCVTDGVGVGEAQISVGLGEIVGVGVTVVFGVCDGVGVGVGVGKLKHSQLLHPLPSKYIVTKSPILGKLSFWALQSN